MCSHAVIADIILVQQLRIPIIQLKNLNPFSMIQTYELSR